MSAAKVKKIPHSVCAYTPYLHRKYPMVHTLKPHIFSEGFYRAQKIPYILYINRYRGMLSQVSPPDLSECKLQQFTGIGRELHEIGIRIGQGADRGRTGEQIGHSSRTIVLKT